MRSARGAISSAWLERELGAMELLGSSMTREAAGDEARQSGGYSSYPISHSVVDVGPLAVTHERINSKTSITLGGLVKLKRIPLATALVAIRP
jgi:hypothetical protein